ncbi:MAG: hypothetical protein ACREMY_02130 [bacterium]
MKDSSMRSGTSYLILGLLLAGASAGAQLQLEPLPKPEKPWKGRQFVAADRSGHVFFLKADTFEIYPLTKSGRLGEPVQLQKAPGLSDEIREAAISPAGDSWLLRVSKGVRLFENDKEKVVPPLEWAPFAVTFRRSTPTIAVAPLPVRPLQNASKVGTLPWIQQLDDDSWSTFRERKGPTLAEMMKTENWFGKILEEDPLFMASDRKGRLWVAHRYAYRLQQFSPGGALLAEIVIDKGKVRKKKDSQPIEIKPSTGENPKEATHAPSQEKGTFFPFTAEAVIQGLAEGPDGRMYFLVVPTGGGAALDRFDPVRGVVERALLQWKAEGDISIAAGKDALYLAPADVAKGRWRVSWDSLEQAEWKKVKGVTLESQGDEEASGPKGR